MHDKSVHGKRYTPVQKLAMRAMVEAGISPTQISKESGVNRDTVYNVMRDERFRIIPQAEVQKIKESLIGSSYQNAWRAQSAITNEKLSESSALQLMTVSAIGIDKGRLMDGLSTENVSFRGIAENIESDRTKLMERLKELE